MNWWARFFDQGLGMAPLVRRPRAAFGLTAGAAGVVLLAMSWGSLGCSSRGHEEVDWVLVRFQDTVVQTVQCRSNIVIAGTRDYGVFLSQDYGGTFITYNEGLSDSGAWDIDINSSHTSFMVTDHGVWRRELGEDSWTPIYFKTSPDIPTISINSSGFVFIGFGRTDYPLVRSVDNGVSWDSTEGNAFGRVIFYGNTCVATNNLGFTHISTDAGSSWSPLLIDKTHFGTVLPNQHFFLTSLWGLYRSTDFGNTWRSIDSSTFTLSYWSPMTSTRSGTLILAVEDEGKVIFSIDEGNHWIEIQKGLPTTGFLELAVDSLGHAYAATGAGLYRTTQKY